MALSILQRAKRDSERITSNKNGFAVEITFTTPDDVSLTISGLHSKTHLDVDGMGVITSSKKAHISVSEKFLTDNNYPVRNDKGEVYLVDHRIDVKDSTDIIKNYVVLTTFPDERLGFITCLLEDYVAQ